MSITHVDTAVTHEYLVAVNGLFLVNLAAGFNEVPDLRHLQTMTIEQLEHLVQQLTDAVEVVLEHSCPLPTVERSNCNKHESVDLLVRCLEGR